MKKAMLIYRGSSFDLRTNKWEFVCECGYSKKLPTTMYVTDTKQCNKCNKRWFINYDSHKISRLSDEA